MLDYIIENKEKFKRGGDGKTNILEGFVRNYANRNGKPLPKFVDPKSMKPVYVVLDLSKKKDPAVQERKKEDQWYYDLNIFKP